MLYYSHFFIVHNFITYSVLISLPAARTIIFPSPVLNCVISSLICMQDYSQYCPSYLSSLNCHSLNHSKHFIYTFVTQPNDFQLQTTLLALLVVHSFLFLSSTPSCEYAVHCLFVYLLIDFVLVSVSDNCE